MRSIVGAVAVVALLVTGCGATPGSGTTPLAPVPTETTTTVAPPAPAETPLPAPPATTTTRPPQPVVPPVAKPQTTTEKPAPAPSAYYANCAAAKAAGVAPLHRGEPGYRAGLDRDNDGIACE